MNKLLLNKFSDNEKIKYFSQLNVENRFFWWADTYSFIQKLPETAQKNLKYFRKSENRTWNEEFEKSFYQDKFNC